MANLSRTGSVDVLASRGEDFFGTKSNAVSTLGDGGLRLLVAFGGSCGLPIDLLLGDLVVGTVLAEAD